MKKTTSSSGTMRSTRKTSHSNYDRTMLFPCTTVDRCRIGFPFTCPHAHRVEWLWCRSISIGDPKVSNDPSRQRHEARFSPPPREIVAFVYPSHTMEPPADDHEMQTRDLLFCRCTRYCRRPHTDTGICPPGKWIHRATSWRHRQVEPTLTMDDAFVAPDAGDHYPTAVTVATEASALKAYCSTTL